MLENSIHTSQNSIRQLFEFPEMCLFVYFYQSKFFELKIFNFRMFLGRKILAIFYLGSLI